MLRVFLAVEGPNDGGALGRSPAARDNDELHEGALQPLLRKLLGDELTIRGQSTGQFFLQDFPEPEDARGRRARRAAVLAAEDGCDVLVFHSDVDGGSSDDDPAHAWADCANAVGEGFHEASSDGETDIRAEACVAALPCRTIEAWLLADPAALGAVGSGAAPTAERVDAPERLWGTNRPGTSHPKHVLRRTVSGHRRPRASTAQYRSLAEASDLTVVAERCPISFIPFRDALLSAAADT